MKGKRIAIIGTYDTKALEMRYVAERIASYGHEGILIDAGPLTGPGTPVQYPNYEVARKAGWKLERLVKEGNRKTIMAAMAEGVGAILLELFTGGSLEGAIGMGGNQGSSIAATAMRKLPIGFPKVLVSTVASGNIRPYVGETDLMVMFSVSDLVGGPNPVSRSILGNAVAAIVGMVEKGEPIRITERSRTVALTALGNTEAAASRISALLKEKGYEVITFHASGAGGTAMEDLIEQGVFGGVIDLTTHELVEEVVGAGAYVPVKPGRLTKAPAKGVPLVVSLGGLEYLCFGPRETIPRRLRKRKIYMHNPLNANVKASEAEMKKAAYELAKRLNRGKGLIEVLIPSRGWSVYGAPGGPLYEPEGNEALLRTLKKKLKPSIPIRELDCHINDEAFASACVDALLRMMEKQG